MASRCPHCNRDYDDTATMAERRRLNDEKLQNRAAAEPDRPNAPLPPDVNTYQPDDIAAERFMASSRLRDI